jgi:hypothetical protein
MKNTYDISIKFGRPNCRYECHFKIGKLVAVARDGLRMG